MSARGPRRPWSLFIPIPSISSSGEPRAPTAIRHTVREHPNCSRKAKSRSAASVTTTRTQSSGRSMNVSRVRAKGVSRIATDGILHLIKTNPGTASPRGLSPPRPPTKAGKDIPHPPKKGKGRNPIRECLTARDRTVWRHARTEITRLAGAHANVW